MNISVINAKYLFKNIIKFFAILTIIIFLVNGIKNISNFKQQNIVKTTKSNINNYSFVNCLDISMSLMSYKKNENTSKEKLTSKKILAMEVGIFNKSIYEDTNSIAKKDETYAEDKEEEVNKIEHIPNKVQTEEITENNIKPRFTTSYGSVQIDNQSDYELTEEILKPDIEITNRKDILIYHTHTCESYTSSERI